MYYFDFVESTLARKNPNFYLVFRSLIRTFVVPKSKDTMPEQNNTASGTRRRRQQPVDNTFAHVQPQATEIERAVLGALMIDKDAYAVVCELLYPESFYEPRNQKIYTAIRELSMHELPVDVWTVTEQLAKQGDLEDVGGPGYVTELSSRVASSANIEYHARIIAQKSLARQLISFSSNIQTKAFESCSHHRPKVVGTSAHLLLEQYPDESL